MLFAAHVSRPTSFRLPAATLRPLALAIALLSGAGFWINTAHAQAPAQVAYDIPAGPLGAVLNRFAQQSGSAISVDAASIQGLHSPGLKGRHDVEEGFRLLLQGSGHTIGRTPTGYVLVPLHSSEASEIQTLPAVKVSASALVGPDELPPVYAGGQVARGAQLGLLGNRSVMDTPFNISSYTNKLIADQQAATVAAVLLNDPSVRFTTSEGHIYENFSIRGFEVNAESLAYNGLYGLAPYGHVPTEFLERVEVLKGPGAMLTGMSPQGSVGGVVNLVPKRALDKPLTRLTAGFSSKSQLGVHLDIGRRFGEDNRFGVRFNGAWTINPRNACSAPWLSTTGGNNFA